MPPFAFGNRLEDKEEKAKKLADKYSDVYGAPGVIVSVATEGKSVASYATGLRDLMRPNELKVSDRLSIGSLSKPVCAFIVGRLVQEKLLEWDTPFSKVCPDVCKDLTSLGSDATVSQLIAHTAGLPYNVSGQDELMSIQSPVEGRLRLCRMTLAAQGATIPGEKMVYAGGANLLAVMAERVSGKTYEELIAKYVNDELGLPSIQNGMESFDERTSAVPRGHFVSKDKHEFLTYGMYTFWGKSAKHSCEATSAITGTAGDVVKLLSAAAGYGGVKDVKVAYDNAHKSPFSISPYTLGGFSKKEGNLYHYGTMGQGEWAAISIVDATKTAIFVYINCNYPDGSFRGTELVNELNVLYS